MGDKPGSGARESADIIQAKAARTSSWVAVFGVIVTAIGTIGGLVVTVMLAKGDKEGSSEHDTQVAVTSRTEAAAPSRARGREEGQMAEDRKAQPGKKTRGARSVSTEIVSVGNVAPKPSGPADLSLDFGGGVTMPLVLVKAGRFRLGSPNGEQGRGYDEAQQQVQLTKDYYIGTYEVTQAQYEGVMKANPSEFQGTDHPVENVSWPQAVEFCRRLSKKTGRTIRLPTEAEWEYATRAGSETPFCFGPVLSSDEANFDGTKPYGAAPRGEARGKTVPVGSFEANVWGLHDVHGNVAEWTHDYYQASYARGPLKDPKGPESGSAIAVRGGSWKSPGAACRSAERSLQPPANGSSEVGFRVVVAVR